VYQGQKVHLFRSSPSFLAEAQPRLTNRRPHERQSKRHHWKNYKFILQTDTFITVVHIFFISLPTEPDIYYIFATQLLILHYFMVMTIIGFVGLVVNLLNRPTDGATISVRKRVTFRPLVST
jgi:hypothetical protein